MDSAWRNALNIVGNYILINGKLGFPEMGLLGAGVSTLFSRIVMVVVFAVIVLRSRRFIRYRLGFMRLGWSTPMFRKLNALGYLSVCRWEWRPLPSASVLSWWGGWGHLLWHHIR